MHWLETTSPEESTATRAHLRGLVAGNHPIAWIAAEVKTHPTVLRKFIRGDRQAIQVETAARVRAIPLPAGLVAPIGRADAVDSTGTARRLRGLVAGQGWSLSALAERLAVTKQALSRILAERWIYRSTAEKIAALTAELTGVPGPSPYAAERARNRGWEPLEAWGDRIDDPKEKPWAWRSRAARAARVPSQITYLPEWEDGYVDPVTVEALLRSDWATRKRPAMTRSESNEIVRRGSIPQRYGGYGLSTVDLGERIGIEARNVLRARGAWLTYARVLEVIPELPELMKTAEKTVGFLVRVLLDGPPKESVVLPCVCGRPYAAHLDDPLPHPRTGYVRDPVDALLERVLAGLGEWPRVASATGQDGHLATLRTLEGHRLPVLGNGARRFQAPAKEIHTDE